METGSIPFEPENSQQLGDVVCLLPSVDAVEKSGIYSHHFQKPESWISICILTISTSAKYNRIGDNSPQESSAWRELAS